MRRLLILVACAACGGSGNSQPCTMTWSGAVSGTGSCTGSASDKLLGLTTATGGSLNWLVTAEDDTHDVSFQYQLPDPPNETSYTGGMTANQFCLASITAKTGNPAVLSANSRPTTSSPARGTCSIAFTSKADTSSSLTRRFEVHGTATASLQAVTDAGVNAQLNVTF